MSDINMEDDCEKSIDKTARVVPSEEIILSDAVNENSNGVLQGIDDSLPADDSAFVPSADFDESNSQGFAAPAFDTGDDTVGFQDNSTNDGESRELPPVVSDGSRNGNDDSNNAPCRESAVNTQQILNDIENTLDHFHVPAENDFTDGTENADSNFAVDSEAADDIQNPSDSILAEVNAAMGEKIENTSDNAVDVSAGIEDIVEVSTDNVVEVNAVMAEKVEATTDDVTEVNTAMEDAADVVSQVNAVLQDTVDDVEMKDDTQEAVEIKDDTQETVEASARKEEVNVGQAGREADTEVVSEDELPTVEKPRVQDAENVSDDELPGPRAAELPADTEVVSEDELPTIKKEREEVAGEEAGGRKRKPQDGDYNPSSPTSDDPTTKKQALTKNGESKPVPVPAEKRASTEEKERKKKVLPELDKYWKVVNEDASDFTGWTYLLQYVDQESDVEAAREAYDAFLSHYPYCYGYWRKYADYEKRKGSKKKCFEVLERGLKAIPLSVDLWIHYLNHIKSTKAEDPTFVRQQYDRAIETCGLEFRSDRLWESYIKWETEHGTPLHVTAVYDRLLATPTLGYTSHFDNFQEHVMSESVTRVVSREELVRVRSEVREGSVAPPPAADLPPGEDEPDDHIASEEEGQAIKERVIALRRKVHKVTGEQVAQRWTFEEGIKRPYFHVKPLERSQLKNWKNYLEWEKQHGSFKRSLVLHERCLIACALYEEFWLRLVKFLEEASETDGSLVSVEREALERACTVHHPDKPALHLHWAYFEEVQGNAARAADILERLDKACPNLLQVAYRRINLERRRGDLDKCVQLYESYISSTKNKAVASALSIKYARMLQRWRNDAAGAQRVLAEAVVRDPLAHRLYLQQLDVALHTPDTPYQQLSGYLEAYERVEGAELETSAAMAWRRLELAEELGTAAAARAAYNHHRALEKRLGKRTRQSKHDPPPVPEVSSSSQKKKESSSGASSGGGASAPSTNSAGTAAGAGGAGGSYYPPAAPPPQPYDQPQYQQPPYQPAWNHYQQHPPNPYHNNPWGQNPYYY